MNAKPMHLMIVLLSFSILLPFNGESRAEKVGAGTKKGALPATIVKVERVKKELVNETISIVGSVEAPRVSRIGSEVEGIVIKTFVEEGDMVKKGRPLLRISNSQLKISIIEAQAEVNETIKHLEELKAGSRSQVIEKEKAAMNEAVALWEKAKNDYERFAQLFLDKVVNESLLTNSQLEAKAAEKVFYQKKFVYELTLAGTRKEKIAVAEAAVQVKKARVALLKDKFKKTTIYSPFNGIIVDKIIEIGEWVAVGQQVFKISQVDPIHITLPVPESVVNQIRINTIVDIQVDAFPGRIFKAKVYKIIPEAKKGSRTFPVILVLKNPKRLLKIGMMARGMLPYGKKRAALFVPQDAITVSQGKNIVYVVDKNNKAKMVPVKTGALKKGLIEVNSALSPGDLVVTRGGERLRPGMLLKILNPNSSQ